MARKLRVLALAEGLGSGPSTHIRQLTTTCNSTSGESATLSGFLGICMHADTRKNKKPTKSGMRQDSEVFPSKLMSNILCLTYTEANFKSYSQVQRRGVTTVPSSHFMLSSPLQASLNQEPSQSTAYSGATFGPCGCVFHVPACSLTGQTLPVCSP